MNGKLLLLFLFFYCCVGSIFSQGGNIRISGKVTDGITGEPLPGVNILIKGTYTGTVSGLDGNYTIMVQGADKVLIFSFIGYSVQEIPVDNKRVIDVNLTADLKTLEEVVVTAQAQGQVGARSQQINSNTIKNVVAPDRLQENPDANAVEAIGRLPGISVQRSGGEGSSLVIRGLESKYTSITMNGVAMPSTAGGNDRSTNISGISQYMLQGVEVFKTLTADQEANSVAGSINLKLKETPKGLHTNLMAQGGYNALNNYYGNYKLLGEVSNRFLNEKVGMFFSINAESVNRSVETMSAGYRIEGIDVNDPLLITNINLNKITTIKHRKSAMLSLDYKIHPSTTLMLYGLYTYANDDHERQSKSYGVTGAGSVGYNFHDNPYRNDKIFQTTLSGETKLKFLNIDMDYGIAYSQSNTDDPDSRNWGYTFENASSDNITTIGNRQFDPSELIPMYTDSPDSLQNLKLSGFGQYMEKAEEKNLTYYMNFKVPYAIGDWFNGYVKFGGTIRNKQKVKDKTEGGQNILANQNGPRMLADSLDWIVRNQSENITAIGLKDYNVGKVLDGQYDFGYYFNFDRLNALTDTWVEVSEYWYAKPYAEWMTQFGERSKIGFSQNLSACYMDDQNIEEDYYAGYVMTEMNFGRYVMFLPGVRLENTDGYMKGWKAVQPTLTDPIIAPLVGSPDSAERSDKFILPMVHLRIKPIKSAYLHLSYTQTLSRPDFNALSPNVYINTGFAPFTFNAQNPYLKAEYWTNYDAQLTFHGNKIGLVSVTGFYKTVEDKIWNRSFTRLKGDPIPDPNFTDNNLVNVSQWENHKNTIFVKGLEFELQTAFYYLPKPFSFFTLYANYTFTNSETQYPLSWVENIIPPAGGRPVPTRFDSTIAGPMLYQPKHIANISLGFNRKGFNAWLSYQHNGEIQTSKNLKGSFREEDLKSKFSRWDMQVTKKIPLKIPGSIEVLGNLANLSNIMEKQEKKGDPRPTYLEQYGWTFDLGVRYKF